MSLNAAKEAVGVNEHYLERVIQVKVRCNPKMTSITVGNCDVCLPMIVRVCEK